MIDVIENETKRIILDFCKRYSKEKKMDLTDVQLILGLNEEGNAYKVCENQKPIKELTFNEILGVKIDFTGYGTIAPPFILKAIVRMSEENGSDLTESCVMCFPTINDNGKPDLLLAFYEGYKYIKQISISDLFNEEDFEIPIQ
jgi:hypothetical protein